MRASYEIVRTVDSILLDSTHFTMFRPHMQSMCSWRCAEIERCGGGGSNLRNMIEVDERARSFGIVREATEKARKMLTASAVWQFARA